MATRSSIACTVLLPLALLLGGCGSTDCLDGSKKCGAVCVDLASDNANCGACGTACAAGQACSAGACALSCAPDLSACGGSCRDLKTDRAHCGNCSTACADGQVCSAGQCALSCTPDLAACSGSCRDLQTDRANCGACGTACAAGQVCSAGHCALSCAPDLTACSGSCRDLQTDRANCGACGTACAAGQVCSAGHCALSCAPDLAACSGSCRDLQTDRANCGACANACAAGQVCSAGHCALSCAPDLAACSGSCRDLQTDRANCGACAIACLAGLVCSTGSCALSCQAGLTSCSGSCRDLLTDRANCGGCGNACAAGLVCASGACAAACGAGLSGCSTGCKDLNADPANCGACGSACTAAEICSAGDCIPCPVARCGNRCTDTQRDPQSCGGCGLACTGVQACVRGACAAPVQVTLLPPVSTGKVGAVSATTPQIRVDSALPVLFATLDVTTTLADGGTQDAGHSALSLASLVDEAPTVWSGPALSFAADGGGHLVFSAYDVAWRADGGDGALHSASAAIDVTVQQPPAAAPRALGLAAGALPLTAPAVFVPLNGPPVTLTAAVDPGGTAAAVQFYNRSASYLLGTAALDGGTAALTVQPADLTAQSGPTLLSACAIDSIEQPGPCQLDAGTQGLWVGKLPTIDGGNPAFLTALADGGSPSILAMTAQDGGSVGVWTATDVVTNLDAGTPLPPAPPFTGYQPGSLVPAEVSSAALATSQAGTLIDRFDCAAGACARSAWVTAGAGVNLGRVVAVTGKAALIRDNGASASVNYDYATFGAVPAAAALVTGGSVVASATGQLAVGTMTSGAIAFASGGGLVQIRVIHPALASGMSAPAGASFTGTLNDFAVGPNGELAWTYTDDTGKRWAAGAWFDGTNPLVLTPKVQVGAGGGDFGWTVVRPGVLVGTGNDAAAAPVFRVWVLDVVQKKLAAPAALFAGTGGAFSGVRGRSGISTWAVSDDQLKLLHLTDDPAPRDPAGHSLSLWITDLATFDQQASTTLLQSSPWLSPSQTPVPDLLPRFVHSAAGASGVTGGAPTIVLASPPAVVWGEVLRDDIGADGGIAGTLAGRLSYALYKADATPPVAVAADRLVAVPNQALPNGQGFLFGAPQSTQESAVAQAVFFLGRADSALYALPLVPATGTGASVRLSGPAAGYQLREDTARLLLQQADGTLWAGRLGAGAPVGPLALVYEGLLSGPASGETAFGPQAGFTPDGDHAWVFAQVGQDATGLASPATAELVALDLGSAARADFGAAFYLLDSLVPSQACFLANATVALAMAPIAPGDPTAALFFGSASATAPAQVDLGLGPVDPQPSWFQQSNNGASLFQPCAVALDGSEGLVQGASGNALVSAAVTPAGLRTSKPSVPWVPNPGFAGGTGYYWNAPISTAAPQSPATWSPYGAPYLDEYDLLPIYRQGTAFVPCTRCATALGPVPGALFKVWGEAAAFPFVPVATGFVPAPATTGALGAIPGRPLTRPSDQNRSLLFSFGSGSGEGFVVALPLAGRAPPRQPIP